MFFDSTSTPRYDYIIRDHLGNTRAVFSDLNGDEVVDSTEILSQHHYYPFGMEMEGEWNAPVDEPYRYSYNGKELNQELDLNWLSYGAREYDPAIGRFVGVDPIADQFPHVNPYNYAENEPVAHIDLWGLQKRKPKTQQYKPKMQPIDKPSDVTFGKVLNNAWQGFKGASIEAGHSLKEVAGTVLNWVADGLSTEGSPDSEDYFDPGTTVPGEGHSLLSNTERKTNGILGVPEAEGGSNQIIESDEITNRLLPADGGGSGLDFASKNPLLKAAAYGSLAAEKIKNLPGFDHAEKAGTDTVEVKGEFFMRTTDSTETSSQHSKFEPINKEKNK